MTGQSENIHWTEDSELLVAYVLDRVDADVRVSLDKHLETCDTCRFGVESELRFAAGVKAHGRKALKKRLKNILEYHHSSSIPLPHILSAAAVILIIAGVGIYSNWFAAKEGVELLQTEEPLAVHLDVTRNKKEAGETQPAVQQRAEKTPRPQSRTQDVPELSRKQSAPPPPVTDLQKETAPESHGGTSGVTAERDYLAASQEQKVDQINDVEGVWLSGNTYEPEAAPGLEMNARHAKRVPKIAAMPEKTVVEERSRRNDLAETRPPILLHQQPLTKVSRERQLEYAGGEQVPALVSTSAEGLILTMFLGHIVPDEILQSAHVKWIGNDSLIVRMQEQTIGYKIPARLLLHQQAIQR